MGIYRCCAGAVPASFKGGLTLTTYHIPYMERSRQFYEAQGFEQPYVWAHFDTVPFHKPRVAVADANIAIITTAIMPEDEGLAMMGRAARSIPVGQAPENFFTEDLSWDKVTTHTRDRGAYFPLDALSALASSGKIGRMASRFHFVPTEFSQRRTIESDAPAILSACIEDEVDIALLVPL